MHPKIKFISGIKYSLNTIFRYFILRLESENIYIYI